MRQILLAAFLFLFIARVEGTVYYAINNGNWSTASNWSLTPEGTPSGNAPKKGDDVYIGSYDIILDVDLISEPGISLQITSGGSLISATNEGLYIKTQGFFVVDGFVQVGSIDLKNDAVVQVRSEAVLVVNTMINNGNIVYMNGDLKVAGTFTNSGTVVGTGSVTAGHYINTGSIFCYTGNPPDGATLYGNGWIGGTPGVENDWNIPTNWCSGYVPGDSVFVVIESTSAYKDIVITAPAQCRSLTLEPGISLSVAENSNLSVVDTIWNEGTLTFKSSAAGTAKLIDGGHIYGSGIFNVELYLSDSSSNVFYHHQVCAPVDNQQLQNFDVVHGETYAYEFHPAGNVWWNIYEETRPIPPMKGILLSTLNSSNIPNTISFSGGLVTGNRSAALVTNAWNLIGNPYPSAIAWDNINPLGGIDNIIYIWNPISKNFVSYVEGTGGNSSCNYIQPGQSFFVFSSFAFNFQLGNKDRVLNNEPYLKSRYSNYLQIEVSGEGNSADEIFFRFMEGATQAYDDGLEALKWESMNETPVTGLSSISSDGLPLQINAMPVDNLSGAHIPLHFTPEINGQYFLNARYLDSFDPSIRIYLEDRNYASPLMYNLRDHGQYTFTANSTDPIDRFVLHFSDDEAFGISELPLQSEIRLIPVTDGFRIENPQQEDIREISVYSLGGSLLAQYVNPSEGRLYRVSRARAACVVRIITTKTVLTQKLNTW
ncbi:MAG: hypothetical protein RQ761_08065 [Bacteroidales bacterium]|nr:hypothetical protein [Bacteroidales bacterium]